VADPGRQPEPIQIPLIGHVASRMAGGPPVESSSATEHV
jgi:hypothetical protein